MQADFFVEAESMHFYKRDPKIMMTKTRGLTDEQCRGLEVFIDLFISEDGSVPDNDHFVSNHLPWNARKWGRVKRELVALGQLEIRDGRLWSLLADTLLKECQNYIETRRKLIEKRWQKPNEINSDFIASTSTSTLNTNTTEDARSARSKEEEEFEEFWKVYPKREGSNPRKPAFLSFHRALRKGASAAEIIDGARRFAGSAPSERRFIPQAVTWLNQERWKDQSSSSSSVISYAAVWNARSARQLAEREEIEKERAQS